MRTARITLIVGIWLIAFPVVSSAQFLGPATKCEAAMVKEAGKLHFCRMKAESKAIKRPGTLNDDLAKCAGKYDLKWDRIEFKYDAACPTSEDQTEIETRLIEQVDDLTTVLSGGTLIECGNDVVDGDDQCDGVDLDGADCASLGLGFAAGSLACTPGCFYDLSVCEPECGNGTIGGDDQCDGSDLGGKSCESLGFASGTLACTLSCSYDVLGCEGSALPLPDAVFPATGQKTCFDSNGATINCAGTGQDGEIQAGGALAYLDNGDGTITDLNTGLMWEKMSDDGSIHDIDTGYVWDDAFAVKIATLNSSAFAGYTDWRLPNYKELPSIVDIEVFSPAVPPAFDTGCTPGCTVLNCSCTGSSRTWSSSTNVVNPAIAWYVLFSNGSVRADSKITMTFRVRGVRGP